MLVNEAFDTLMESLDAQYRQACQDLDATRNALDAKYTQTRTGLINAGSLMERLVGNPNATTPPTSASNASPAPSQMAKSTRLPRKRTRPRKKANVPTVMTAAPSPLAAAEPTRSARRAVFDAIEDWNTSEGITAATGFPPKKIRGVLSAKDLQDRIERQIGEDGRLQYKAKPRTPATPDPAEHHG